jgi:hypothetical protein
MVRVEARYPKGAPLNNLLYAFDGHAVDDVRSALDAGADASAPIEGRLTTEWLLEEYTRSERLPHCLQLLLDRGATLRDPRIAPVLLDDATALEAAVRADPSLVSHRTTMKSAFTSLEDVTLLHVAAEYGHVSVARKLIELGADVNAAAGIDADGLNGHTPIFHTVNSNGNRSLPVMEMLIAAGADCEFRVKGLHWGKGYEWHTVFFDVTPISFAQAGLFPQVNRRESDVYANVSRLLQAVGRPVPSFDNLPNKYLLKG